jgi:uncharacterized membrane protein YeaQ/YmgE (transglycosylase-associated protein family)
MKTDIEVQKAFIDFLLNEKGYPEECLAVEAVVGIDSKNTYRADLIIYDVLEKQYLSLIEFKNQINQASLNNAIKQVSKYIELIDNPDLPIFLVAGIEKDFEIYILMNLSEWVKIEKEDFPSFKKLSKSIITKEMLRDAENLRKEIERKNKLQRNKSLASLFSIIVAIIGGIITLFLGTKIEDNNKLKDNEISVVIENLKSKIEDNNKISEKTLTEYKNFSIAIDSLNKKNKEPQITNSIKLMMLQSEMKVLAERNDSIQSEFSHLKTILSTNPLRVIELNNIKTDIVLLDKDVKSEIHVLQNNIDALKEKYNFIIGGIITIIGAILILALPNAIQLNKK